VEQGIAREQAAEAARRDEAVRKAAAAINPFGQPSDNPFEKTPANPFENVQVNPFK
jgi:hypothetical protein